MHPATASLLAFFDFAHLPPHLADVSKPFATLASYIAHTYEGAEATAGLRKLLEAKDCIVRAAVEKHRAEFGARAPESRRITGETPVLGPDDETPPDPQT